MGDRINLRDPGSSHTLRVQSVSVNKSGKWPDYDFTDGTVVVAVPVKAADRQFERLGIASVVEFIGATLKVSRTEKTGDNGKPFWDLELVNAAAATPKASPRVKPADADPTQGIPDHHKLHPADQRLPFDEEPGEFVVQDLGDEPPLTPREAKALSERDQREADYLALMERVALRCADLKRLTGIPFDGSAVQAACFSLWGITGRPK